MSGVWITFKPSMFRGKARKTRIWEVWTIAEDVQLGEVRWYSPWRKYCFFPYGGTVWEQDCLRVLAEFIETQTREHKRRQHVLSQTEA